MEVTDNATPTNRLSKQTILLTVNQSLMTSAEVDIQSLMNTKTQEDDGLRCDGWR